MHWFDWSIPILLVGFITFVAIGTKRYMVSVADFLSANRCAGKYLLGVASGISGLGAISIVAIFEMNYKAGFTAAWWSLMLIPIGLIIAATGWIQYRFRQTRAMTMAQFFEIRYSRSFRIFAGLMGYISGIINFGIFPAVGGRFFQYYCGLPEWPLAFGPFTIDAMYALIMILLLSISLAFTLWGGQIAVMVTDFIQGMFINIVFVIIGFYLLFFFFDWQTIVDTAIKYAPQDASLLNPMKTSGTENFNLTYFLISAFGAFYAFMAWQGSQGYFSSARSPHDARMGQVVGLLRTVTQILPLALLPVCAFVFLHNPEFAASAAEAQTTLNQIESEQVRSQLTVTVAIKHFLPVGILGLFAAVMLAAFISTHNTYLHSWGSIFIQDVVMPIHQNIVGNKVVEPATHLRWLRYSIIGVVIFIFLFSLLFSQQQDILMFFALTGTLYLGWAGSCIIGGLYWRRGNIGGAWAATIGGVLMAILGWYMTYKWVSFQTLMNDISPTFWTWATQVWPTLLGEKCPITAQVLWFWTMVASIFLYVIGSLIHGQSFDMDELLHQNKLAEETKEELSPLKRVIGMGKEFSLGDRLLLLGSYAYVTIFFLIFMIGTVTMLNTDISDQAWGTFWWWFCIAILLITLTITATIGLGGLKNLREMYALLANIKRNEADDGTVLGHRNLADITPIKQNK